ncbi:MAG: SNF2-related protein, partial [Candidatus Cryptobacteroides sp.]
SETFQLLRSLDAIRDSGAFRISWGGGQGLTYIDEHPQLIYQILRCRNVVGPGMKPLKGGEGVYTANIDLVDDGEGNSTPQLYLCLKDSRGNENAPRIFKDFRMITDSFAITDGLIVETEPVGDEYLKLDLLNEKIAAKDLEQYLTVIMSNFENVNLRLNGVPARIEEVPVKADPTLVFEKVDEDKSLYIRMTESIPGIPLSFTEDFSPTRLVSIDGGEASVRKVEYGDLYGHFERMKKVVAASATDKKAAKEIYSDDGFFVIPADTAGNFIIQNLAGLMKEYTVLGSDKLAGYKVRAVSPKFRIRTSSGIDFLESNADIEIGDETFSLKDFLAQYRKNRYIELGNGDKGIIDELYVKRLERILNSGKRGRKEEISFFDLPEIISLTENVPDTGIFRRCRDFYDGFNALPAQDSPAATGLNATLRPYQEYGVKWLNYLYDNGMGGCLADDMGLGKTVQTIAMILSHRTAVVLPTLIVMPRSLLFNWKAELAKFAPSLTVGLYYGNGRNLDEACANDIVLTTYAVVRNDIENLMTREFECIILDESQNIKNSAARMSQAVLLLKAEHRFALSGTPVENNLGELYSLFHFLNPEMFGAEENFNEKYASPIQREGDKEALQQLRRKIFPFLLRRMKKDVLKDLPDRIDQTLQIEMEPEHAEFYERRRRFYYETLKGAIRKEGIAKAQFEMLQALSELRRIASIPESLSEGSIKSSKIPVLAEAVSEAVSNGHKTVVFFNFIAGIELLGEQLDAEGIDYAVMTGATRDRKSVTERFQEDPQCKVLLMTLKTGGVGLNLTAADTVFIAEPWWNRSAEEQAIGRLHRIGQKCTVHSFSTITTGTIEEKIQLLQQRKADLVEALITSDATSSKALSEEDIDFILG